jgi:hypothetical protein
MKGHYIVELDGVFATPGDKDGPIGEPVPRVVNLVRSLLWLDYRISLLSWRDPGLVYVWLQDCRLSDLLDHPLLSVVVERPGGMMTGYIAARPATVEDLEALISDGGGTETP